MRIAAVSHVEMTVDPAKASARILLKSGRLQAIAMITGGLVGVVCLLYPMLLIALDAATNPQVVQSLGEHPGSAVLLAAGVAVGLALLVFPIRSGLAHLTASATVRLADGHVAVDRQGLFRQHQWSEPLAKYCGVTHHIRATLSGARHEIILVHPDPDKDVLLNLSPRHPQQDAAYYADLLGVGELQPRILYQRKRSAPPRPIPASPQARAA